jgi:hypothetical protein
MATRSTIGILNSDGSATAVYCHWDGYPEYNGKILSENYDTSDKVRELLAMGSISSLGRQIGEKHPFSRFEDDSGEHPLVGAAKEARIELAEQEGWTRFFARDRGEQGVEARTFANPTEFVREFGEEYNYLFVNDRWFVNQYGAEEHGGQAVFDMVEFVLEQREAERECA